MENNLTYTKNGDYLIPDLTIQETSQPIGKYGRMRKKYLQEHRPILWNSLILQEKLFPHLLEIEQAAQSRLELMMPELMKA
ncbi:MAG: TnpV protein, partial [Gammaproteobacteria bacterium]|nr:TnpV protein [Gammaproteobacteria bacterium]